MIQPDGETSPGSLFENLLLFGRVLRGLGLDVDTGRMIDLVQALEAIEIGNKADFYYTLRCLLVRRREDFPVFDQAFDLFWRKPGDGRLSAEARASGTVRPARKPRVVPAPLRLPDEDRDPQPKSDPPGQDEPPLVQATLTYSHREMLRKKDFAELSPAELEEIKRLLSELAWQLGMRRTRRFQPGGGPSADLRRTFRRNLQYGGEVLAWSRREPKVKPRPLVIIADISGSMERYTRLLLHFAYSLSKGFEQGAETFVFSTRLTRITHPLKKRNVDEALKEISQTVPDWSGGTRIGEALKAFNFGWARRVLGQGAVVLLISDGWDRGDPELLRSRDRPPPAQLPPADLAESTAGLGDL